LGATNIQLVQNGIDTTVFKKREGANCRQKLGISNDAIVITFVGRLIYAKGVQDLITAFPGIKDTAMDTKLLIVGDGPYRTTLENLAYQSTCGRDILFLGRKIQAELIDILSVTDVFVNPSYSEGLPTSIMEAASIGLPIIATDVGGTGEIITDYKTGILIKAANRSQLEQKLRELLTNTELRKELGANARISVERKFSWDKTIQDWIKLVEGIE
jgi:phosphatidylinositol alpha-1,6-mannosyltransferase